LQRPADGEGRDVVTTHFAYEYLHETLLKLDLLGHDVPTKYKMLETYTNKSVMDVPMDDKNVYELFLSTKSLGVSPEDISSNVGTYGLPEFGTKYVRQMLEDTKPKCFADLLQISGLSHGTDVWLGNAQELIKDNVCTISDVVGTRDNIMVKLIYYGLDKAMAFSIMEHVRKKDKNLTPEMEDEMRKHDVPEWYIESCKKIKYMFPKAHAAAYVISAIRLAWFKVYYPLEFYCAYFSAEPDGFEGAVVMQGITAVRKYIEELEGKGNQLNQKEKKSLSAMQLVNEMMSRGIKVLPVDLYKSDAFRFIPENGKMRIPFSRLAGVGESAAENICNAMKNEQIHSIVEFKEKTGVSKTVLETLRQNGVLDVLPETDQISMF